MTEPRTLTADELDMLILTAEYATTRDGRLEVTLEQGEVQCYAPDILAALVELRDRRCAESIGTAPKTSSLTDIVLGELAKRGLESEPPPKDG